MTITEKVIITKNRTFLLYIFFYLGMIQLIVTFQNEISIFLTKVSVITFNLVEPNLLLNLFLLAILGLLLKYLAKLSLMDILSKSSLLNKRKFFEGLYIFFLVFCLLHIFIWSASLAMDEPVVSIFSSGQLSFNEWVGIYIGQIFGTALHEEFIVRFILFWSLYYLLKFKGYIRLLISLFITQLLFGVLHLPILGGFNHSFIDLLYTLGPYLVTGLIYQFIYLYTNNLWIPIFIHGFYNIDLPLFVPLSYKYHIFNLNFSHIILIYALIIVTTLFNNKRGSLKLP